VSGEPMPGDINRVSKTQWRSHGEGKENPMEGDMTRAKEIRERSVSGASRSVSGCGKGKYIGKT
jgi:hypothetical protein